MTGVDFDPAETVSEGSLTMRKLKIVNAGLHLILKRIKSECQCKNISKAHILIPYLHFTEKKVGEI
jgi:hypothetical protein